MTLLPAARITDPTAHGATVLGALGGAAAGAVGGAIFGASVGGPLGAVAGALVGGLLGGLAGAAIGSFISVNGSLTSPGSANVTIDNLKAARLSDFNACGMPPHAPNQVISGAEFVTYNGLFASRETDKSICSGNITQGSKDVVIGGPTLEFRVHQTAKSWLTGTAAGNTMVAVSSHSKTIYILSFLEYSGPNASQQYAADAKAQIEAMWGGQTATINGVTYNVNVQVNTQVRNASDPATPGYDQINVDSAVTRADQYLYGDGGGNQNPSNVAPSSYVAAHEYGHSLGLPDEYVDTPTGSQPIDPSKTNNIMSQTWPDASGNPPHPYNDHYEAILNNYGWP